MPSIQILPIRSRPQSQTAMAPPQLPPQFQTLPLEIRRDIFEHLIPLETTITIPFKAQSLKNTLTNLSHTCTQLHDEIKEWCQSTKRGLKQSHKIGIFHPDTTIFHLDLKQEAADTKKARRKFRGTWNEFREFCLWNVHRQNLKHLIVDVETVGGIVRVPGELISMSEFDAVIDAVMRFVGVKDVVFTLLKLETIAFRLGDEDRDVLGEIFFAKQVWAHFWEKPASIWCHPGSCCTCCVLPELKIIGRFTGKEGLVLAFEDYDGVRLTRREFVNWFIPQLSGCKVSPS